MTDLKPVSLLLVHPDSDDRDMYAEYFRAEGLSVTEVGTTDDALPLLGSCDALVTGLMVPGTLDPLDFIHLTRSKCPSLPIVAISASAFDGRMKAAERAGADVMLLKPCLPDRLLQEVYEAIERMNVQLVPVADRREVPDRRAAWRGGR